jgi:hypothetical protein
MFGLASAIFAGAFFIVSLLHENQVVKKHFI